MINKAELLNIFMKEEKDTKWNLKVYLKTAIYGSVVG